VSFFERVPHNKQAQALWRATARDPI
jgi:hypothetical protein